MLKKINRFFDYLDDKFGPSKIDLGLPKGTVLQIPKAGYIEKTDQRLKELSDRITALENKINNG